MFIPISIPLIQLKLAPPARKENNKLIQKLLTWKVEQKLVGLVRFQKIYLMEENIQRKWNHKKIHWLTNNRDKVYLIMVYNTAGNSFPAGNYM